MIPFLPLSTGLSCAFVEVLSPLVKAAARKLWICLAGPSAPKERERKEGHNEALRQALLAIMQARFPSPRMIRQAKGQAAIIDDPAVLQDLIVKVSLAESAEEAERYLLDWPSFDNQQN